MPLCLLPFGARAIEENGFIDSTASVPAHSGGHASGQTSNDNLLDEHWRKMTAGRWAVIRRNKCWESVVWYGKRAAGTGQGETHTDPHDQLVRRA